MKPLAAEIADIVQMIWSTLIDAPIERDGEELPSDASMVTGIVNIDGAWRGAVLVRCSLALATLLTEAMFQGDEAATLEEVSDAMGELTNMVAGNTKALLPQPSAISLPTVAFGSHYEISVKGTRSVATVAFTSESSPLIVSVVQHSDDIPERP